MSQPWGDPHICVKCIGAKRFANWIRDHGKVGACEIEPEHGRSQEVVPVSEFAQEVDTWFRETYAQGGEEAYVTEDSDNLSYEQRGAPYEDILMDELECGDRALRIIAEHLPDVSHRDIAQGAEPFYDDSQNYEEIASIKKREREVWEEHWYESRFRYQWQDFCEWVQYGRRFFQLKSASSN